MQTHIKNSLNLLKKTKTKQKRYLFEKIDFSQRLIGIVGQRGVGKTTLLLQYLNSKKQKTKVIYFSADNLYFLENSLLKTVEELYFEYGMRTICIDEVHKYNNWSQEIKNAYDSFPDLQILFSGSSSLEIIHNAYDLSRRAVIYPLYGLSFREYLHLNNKIQIKPLSVERILKDYKSLSVEISSQFNILENFGEFLKYGYYPYFLEGKNESFLLKVKNALDKTIYEDISNLQNLKTENLYLFKRILNFLATIPPGEVSINKLAKNLGVAFETVELYLDLLHKISLIRYLVKDVDGYKLIRKTSKVFIDNASLLFFISLGLNKEVNRGTLRELFLLNQLQNSNNKVFSPHKKGDFDLKTQNRIVTLEVGGKSKDKSQIFNQTDSFLVLDDLEIAENRKIPLWLFGFLY